MHHRAESAAYYLRQSPLFRTLADSDLAGLDPPPEIISIAAGDVLMRQGELTSEYYHVISGRLRVFVDDGKGHLSPVGHVNPGEGVGEMSMLTGNARSATVIARLDSTLVRFGQSTLLKLIERYPGAALEIARSVIQRLGSHTAATYQRIAIIPLQPDVDSRTLAQSLTAELARFGTSRFCEPHSAGETPDSQHSEYEVYDAGWERTDWSRYCFLHADLILFAVAAGARCDPEDNARLSAGIDRALLGRMDLLVVHPENWLRDCGTGPWIRMISPQEHHHLRAGGKDDMARLARLITGHAINLVLGGGGARAFAEFGVVRALREAGVPIDRVCGASMGAFVGAICAYHGNFRTLVALARDSFRRRRPGFDFTLPILSALKGQRLQEIAKDVCDDWRIEDLPLTFFCLSAHLGTAELVTHNDGPVWVALRSSGAMPVVGPPLLVNQQILIDGGALNNLPVDIMRERFSGTTVVVDVSVDEEMRMNSKWELSCPSGFSVLWEKLKPFGKRAEIPNIFEILYRTMCLSTQARLRETRDTADWLIDPPVEGFSVMDFNNFEKLEDLGYKHTVGVLEEMRANPELIALRGLENLF